MKPLWTQTLAWIAAVVVAILLALANPAGIGIPFDFLFGAHSATATR